MLRISRSMLARACSFRRARVGLWGSSTGDRQTQACDAHCGTALACMTPSDGETVRRARMPTEEVEPQ
ncbi:hypothetical protein C0Z18_16130 [Trinickia dabaoshanensis]|uniref:Uncharacterized protein n=1 Tax=Trinickia dabaoshanensis TaxID=564714 RepID=A0A2N7VNW8_9BURK|nr:hypothetical protein C0Z18_16130 [Trinickia dabaoshanensis]